MKERVIYAIDLGTTYSKCAFVDPRTGSPVVVAVGAPIDVMPSHPEDIDRYATIRSAVALGTERERRVAWVGDEARARSRSAGHRLIEESKAWIGRAVDPDDVEAPPWWVDAHRWEYRPEEVGALILRRIKAAVDRLHPQWPMTHVVITHPQNFEDTRREATRQAGRLAGLEVVATMSEPDAAAYFFGVRRGATGRHLIFDLGGGTLDVTVAEFSPAGMRVLGSAGSHAVAGRDHDRAVFDHLVDAFGAEHRDFAADVHLDAATRAEWMQLAERMKVQICDAATKGTVALAIGQIECVNEEAEFSRLRVKIDAARYEQLTVGLTRESIDTAETALQRAGIGWGDLDGAVMVGGSSWNPWIRRALAAKLGPNKVKFSSDVGPSTAIVLGAAMYAHDLAKGRDVSAPGPDAPSTPSPATRRSRYSLASVVPRSLGIRALNRATGQVEPVEIIKRGQAIPTRIQQRFLTTQAGADSIPIKLFEWPDFEGGEPEQVGLLRISGLPPGRPAGQRVIVTIEVDASNQKTVTAVDEATGLSATSKLQFDERRVLAEPELEASEKHLLTIELRMS